MAKGLVQIQSMTLRRLIAGWLLLVAVCQTGCQECYVEREFNHPTRPTNTRGWDEFQHGTTTVKGDFVLSVGESVNNGKVGVKVSAINAKEGWVALQLVK
jgi:hypothetical protein